MEGWDVETSKDTLIWKGSQNSSSAGKYTTRKISFKLKYGRLVSQLRAVKFVGIWVLENNSLKVAETIPEQEKVQVVSQDIVPNQVDTDKTE